MTAKRASFSLVCLSPDEGGLIAIGGYNDNYIDVVECLDGEGATEWRLLAPFPLPLNSRGGVYFKQRILFVGGYTAGGTSTSATLAFTGGRPWSMGHPKAKRYQAPKILVILPYVEIASFLSVSSPSQHNS